MFLTATQALAATSKGQVVMASPENTEWRVSVSNQWDVWQHLRTLPMA